LLSPRTEDNGDNAANGDDDGDEEDEEPRHPLDDPELIRTSVARSGHVVPDVCFNVEYRQAARRFIERDLKILGKARDWKMPVSNFGAQHNTSEWKDNVKELRRFAELHGTSIRIVPLPDLPEYPEVVKRRTQQDPFPPCNIKYSTVGVSRNGETREEVSYTVVPISNNLAFEQNTFKDFKKTLAEEVVPEVHEMHQKLNDNPDLPPNLRKDPTIAQMRDNNLLLRKVAAIAMLALWPKDTSFLAAYFRQFSTHFSRERLKAVEGLVRELVLPMLTEVKFGILEEDNLTTEEREDLVRKNAERFSDVLARAVVTKITRIASNSRNVKWTNALRAATGLSRSDARAVVGSVRNG
jgi:hypothetical protein